MAKKQVIRLTEGDLHRIIKDSVNKVLKESIDSVSPDPFGTSAESYHTPSDKEINDYYERRPYCCRNIKQWSSIGLLHKMLDRISIAKDRDIKNGMQGFFEDLEDLIDCCEDQIRKGN